MNSATEFAELLEKVKLEPGVPSNAPVAEAWSRLFNVEQGSADFYLVLAAVREKLERARDDLANANVSERSRGLFLGALTHLERFVSGQSVYNQQVSQITDAQSHIDVLFMAGEALPEFLVPEINPLTLDQVIAEIEGLIDSIGETEFEPRFRSAILAQLRTLLIALRSYEALGPEGAAKVYGAAAAELARLSGSPDAQQPKAKGITSKALGLCKKVGAVVIFAGAVVSGAHDLLTDGSELLGIEKSEVDPSAD